MSEVGEMYAALKEQKKAKKESNYDWSVNYLRQLGIDFDNHGYHLVVKHNGNMADFWPTTGKYNIRVTKEYRRGVKRLVKDLKAPAK